MSSTSVHEAAHDLVNGTSLAKNGYPEQVVMAATCEAAGMSELHVSFNAPPGLQSSSGTCALRVKRLHADTTPDTS